MSKLSTFDQLKAGVIAAKNFAGGLVGKLAQTVLDALTEFQESVEGLDDRLGKAETAIEELQKGASLLTAVGWMENVNYIGNGMATLAIRFAGTIADPLSGSTFPMMIGNVTIVTTKDGICRTHTVPVRLGFNGSYTRQILVSDDGYGITLDFVQTWDEENVFLEDGGYIIYLGWGDAGADISIETVDFAIYNFDEEF